MFFNIFLFCLKGYSDTLICFFWMALVHWNIVWWIRIESQHASGQYCSIFIFGFEQIFTHRVLATFAKQATKCSKLFIRTKDYSKERFKVNHKSIKPMLLFYQILQNLENYCAVVSDIDFFMDFILPVQAEFSLIMEKLCWK